MGNVLTLCLLSRRRGKPGNYKLVGVTSASERMVEYLVLESISNHVDRTKINTGAVSTDLVRAIHA